MGGGRLRRSRNATVPAILIEHLPEDQRRAYVIADNRLAEKAGWDKEILEIELQHLVAAGFEVEVTRFEVPEVDLISTRRLRGRRRSWADDDAPDVRRDRPAVTRPGGNLWLMGPKGDPRHRLLAGDARDPAAIARLMGDEQAAMVITDPPYNVPIKGHVSSKSRTHHKEFAMASGEIEPTRVHRISEAFSRGRADQDGARRPPLRLYGLAPFVRDAGLRPRSTCGL